MLILTLWQLPDIPVVLGPTGAILAFLVIIAQTGMTFYSWRKSTAISVLEKELQIYKAKSDRQEKDIEDLQKEEHECRRHLER
jgi:hypothetical protein